MREDHRYGRVVLAGDGILKPITSPLTAEVVSELRLGDIVTLSGPIVTGRDDVYIRALEYVDAGKDVPACLKGAVVYHCGPIMKQDASGNWAVVAAGPTTSARMNKLGPRFIREFGIRAIIGKGGMDGANVEAMKECGCVYLAATGGVAVSYAEGLGSCSGAEWADLGMAESMWKFDARRLGPLVVAIDAHGNSLYDRVNERVRENLAKRARGYSGSSSSRFP